MITEKEIIIYIESIGFKKVLNGYWSTDEKENTQFHLMIIRNNISYWVLLENENIELSPIIKINDIEQLKGIVHNSDIRLKSFSNPSILF